MFTVACSTVPQQMRWPDEYTFPGSTVRRYSSFVFAASVIRKRPNLISHDVAPFTTRRRRVTSCPYGANTASADFGTNESGVPFYASIVGTAAV